MCLPDESGPRLNPTFIKYPIFESREIINDFKVVVKSLGFSVGPALLELEQYRTNPDTDGLSVYSSPLPSLQDLPNPGMYWRYYYSNNMKLLPEIAKTIFNIVPSSSLCEHNFRDHEYVYSSRRLRTNPARFEKLVFVYSNSKM